ncbi:DUF6252 family protein [Aquimarina gracilis]|uniref:DUF6252 family protein n=1 Tax=Aquimarina gracilis TaxID=874422 RepID=A0ABU5ZT95_9FLAO|nr:DUF6252 family protein [Aquimarina gracilis]MEB3345199.1 DUF6252 family protein [Aquimarina gracilis]
MIRITTLLLAVFCLVFTSCSTDIEINDPALQAQVDGENFRSSSKKAMIHDDGTLVIVGSEGDQSISFTIAATKMGVYKMGQTLNEVSFQKNQTKFFVQDQETEGEVTITEIYNNEISGNFYFKNLKDSNGNSSSFNNGWFYRLPIENAVIEDTVAEEINPCLLNASLTAMVDGYEMITDDHTARLFGVDNVSIMIKATNAENEIEIVFPSDAAPGTYALSGSGDYSATFTKRKDKSSALSGTIIITEHNIDTKCLSGSFEFETRSGVQVSEGVFDFGY